MVFSDIHAEFEARLRRYAMGLTRGDSDAADDLVQETFVRVSGNLSLLGGFSRRQRRAWVMRVLKNIFIDEHRARRRNEEMIEELVREADLAPYTIDDLLSSDLLENTAEEDRDLLEKRYVEGMTSGGIAKELGIPAATVRSRLRLALGRLRRQYVQHMQEEA